MKKPQRIEAAEDSLKIIQDGYFISPEGKKIVIKTAQQDAHESTQVWTTEALSQLLRDQNPTNDFDTQFEVTGETTLNAVRRLIHSGESIVMCLNFASAKNPGGGFLTGAQAQEESIARATGLYPCLTKAQRAYYDLHRQTKTCLYTDTMIFSPKVPIFKQENATNLSELMTVSVLTSAAVNAGVVRRQELHNIPQLEPVMRLRIRKMLALAATNKQIVLVLGAWGCGVFQNQPTEIAQWFWDVLQLPAFKRQFKKIVFGIYASDPKFITPFQKLFVNGKD